MSDNALDDGEIRKSGVFDKEKHQHHVPKTQDKYGEFRTNCPNQVSYGDSGSFSRFFDLDAWWVERIKKLPESVQRTFPFLIVTKASKSERNQGLEQMELDKDIGHNRFDKCATCGGYILQNQERPSACHCENPIRENNRVKGNFHPTVKPLKLMSYLITLGSRANDVVLDPFMGSGTTCMAAKMLGRHYIGIELEKQYVEIAEARVSSIPPSLISFTN